jgi:hypothetical protein
MLRNQLRLLGFLAPIALVAFVSATPSSAQKPTVVSAVNKPLSLSLTADANIINACDDGGAPKVKLMAKAVSPDGNPIKYRWTTSAGKIIGEGPEVTWNMAGLNPGYHKASLDIVSANGDSSCQAFSSVSVLVNPCVPLKPVCPSVEVVCPTSIGIDQPLTFTSNVTGGGNPSSPPVHNWTVSAGTIIEGQGTNTIKVDTRGLAGQTIKASLSIEGYTLVCAAECAVSVPLPKLMNRKFDEFPDISRNDEKARLDNFGIELQNDPTATAYVVVYPGKHGKRDEVQQHAGRIVEYLVNSRGLDQRRIVTLVGPTRDALFVELWITPQGATPPNPQ